MDLARELTLAGADVSAFRTAGCHDLRMGEAEAVGSQWRRDVDLEKVQLALVDLRTLLEAVAATGSSLLLKVDGERVRDRIPRLFTVVISDAADESGPIRVDDSDLGRAVLRAVAAFDARH